LAYQVLRAFTVKKGVQKRRYKEMGASPPTAGTGLSACIFFACGKKGYRFNPLRESIEVLPSAAAVKAVRVSSLPSQWDCVHLF
jgi:hypothetical protein